MKNESPNKKSTFRLIFSLLVFCALSVSLYVFYLFTGVPKTADEALNKFFNNNVAEDQIMDPLILAGSKVVPLLLEKISDKSMQNRRYAIGAIGNIGDENAIPKLIGILNDPVEDSYFRCDALNSIAMISQETGRKLAQSYKADNDKCLAQLSEALLSSDAGVWEKMNYMKRTYWQALLGRHS